MLLALATVAAVAGACVQSATGFGYALVLGPAVFAALSATEAVTALLVAGLALNLLMLAGEGRTPRVRWHDVGPMLAAAVPATVGGVLVLRAVEKPALQVAVGVAVLAAVAVQVRPRVAPRELAPATAYPVGAVAGVLTTSTSVNGPPLLLWLQARGATPAEIRDSLAASFLTLSVTGTAALIAINGVNGAVDAGALALLIPATAAGHAAGRAIYERLDPARFRAITLALALLAGLLSLLAGLLPA